MVISGESGAVGMGLIAALMETDEYKDLREATTPRGLPSPARAPWYRQSAAWASMTMNLGGSLGSSARCCGTASLPQSEWIYYNV